MTQRTMMRRTRIAAVIGGLLLAASVSAATWQEGNTYSAGTTVDYNGKTYTALVTHTAYVGANWNPASTPTLWKETGTSSSTPTPTTAPTIAPTATPVSTNAPTATPVVTAKPTTAPTTAPTATPVSGVPAWSSSAVYNGGERVSYNGGVYEAKWWTQNNVPGADQWGPWKLISGTVATPTPTAVPTPTSVPTASPVPTVSPVPTATPVVTATPTPAPTATPCASNCPTLPKHAVVGYWHNFDNGSGVIRLKDVPDEYDIINVSFAEGDPWTKGKAVFTLDKLFNEADFLADIKLKQAAGKKVQVSLGGANGVIVLDSAAARDAFIASMGDIIAKYGFDGIDIDIENNLSIGAGEDFRNPTTPQVVNLVAGVKALKQRFGGSFSVTMAPEVAYVQGGYGVAGGIWGGYLGIIHGLRNELTMLHVQHYNTGGISGKDDKTYNQGTIDFQVAMTDMLLTGFNVGRDANKFFPPLRPDQVGIGLPSTAAAAPSGGYLSVADTQKALDCLMKLQNCGSYKPLVAQPDLRGVMTWSINWDKTSGYSFAKGHKAYLNTYPK